MELVEREMEILRLLGYLKNTDFVLVGGYAVSTLTVHRFSVDCDLVVSGNNDEIKSIIRGNGYKFQMKRDGFDAVYSGRFENYAKKINSSTVAVDLLINSLVSRGTNASWSFEYIKKHSVISKLTPEISCKVPERELLVAMKVHSGRKTDIRDIVMLVDGCDFEKALSHIKRGDMKLLMDKINQINAMLDDRNLIDSLKGVFRLERDVEKDVKRAKKFVAGLKEKLLL